MTGGWHSDVRVRRGIFALANVTAFAALMTLVILPIHELFADRDAQIAERRAMLTRFSAVAAQAPFVKRLASHSEAKKDRPEFLRGANEGVIAANLQTRLKKMAQGAGAQLRSIRSIPIKVDDDVKLIGAEMDIVGPIRAVYLTVSSIETTKPYLFIVEAVLKSSRQFASRATNSMLEPTVDAQLSVIGALRAKDKQ